jgi:hypothetical protein
MKVRKWESRKVGKVGRWEPEADGRRQREALAEGNVSRRCLRRESGKVRRYESKKVGTEGEAGDRLRERPNRKVES